MVLSLGVSNVVGRGELVQLAIVLIAREASHVLVVDRKRSAAPPQLSLTYNKSLSRTQCK